jgi:DNA polymerase-3 subunit epsilon
MLVLAYDTETTGIPKGQDYTDPSNPFLAAIAMILYDTEARRVMSSFNAAVQPEGWVMPEEAGQVNGLTTEYLNKFGIPSCVVVPVIIGIASKADLLIAHNIEFDTKIIAASIWRQLQEEEEHEDIAYSIVKMWLDKPQYCTMKKSKDVVRALNKKGAIKAPKLTEAYRHFFGKELDRAHSANADAVAVLEIYSALQAGKG